MRVLFVQPPFGSNRFASAFGIAEPLAYEILSSTVHHHDVKIFDMRLDKTPLTKEIETFNPNVVGVGCVTAGYYECVNVLKETKKFDPGIITIVGGHHATVMPQDFLGGLADFIVLGEGEKTFPELIDFLEMKKSLTELKGLAIPKDDKLHLTDERPLINIDEMPIPNRRLTQKYRNNYFRGTRRPYASIIGSRGCSFRCKFCCQWILNRGTYRVRSPKKIVDELYQIQEPYVDFSDDNSWEDISLMEELYTKIKEARINKKYKLYSRADLIIRRPDLIEKWKSIGLEAVLIGFESYKDEDLKKWNKKITVKRNIEASRILKDHNVEIIGNFMIDPSYTEEDFLGLIDHVQKLDIDQPVFSILTPFPGTPLYDEIKDIIITNNYDYFDGMHALTPTVIEPIKFYKLYTDLFRKMYPKRKLVKKILKGKIGFTLPQAFAQMKYLKRLGPVQK